MDIFFPRLDTLLLVVCILFNTFELSFGRRGGGSRGSYGKGSKPKPSSNEGHFRQPPAHPPTSFSYPMQSHPPVASAPAAMAPNAPNYPPATHSGAGLYPPTHMNSPSPAQHSAPQYPSNFQPPSGATAAHNPTALMPPAGPYHVPQGPPAYQSYPHIPPGDAYHPNGQVSQGFPAPTHYVVMPPGPTHVVALPPGAALLPVGSALPAGAIYNAAPPPRSSSLGFGSGIAAGALGTLAVEHIILPGIASHFKPSTKENQNQNNTTIIINNYPNGAAPASNANINPALISSNQQQVQSAQPASPQEVPADYSAQPAQSVQPSQTVVPSAPPIVSQLTQPTQFIPNYQTAPNISAYEFFQTPQMGPIVQPVPFPNAVIQPPAFQANPALSEASFPHVATEPSSLTPGSTTCAPVQVLQPDPNDVSKTIKVDRIACYPASPTASSNTPVFAPPQSPAVSLISPQTGLNAVSASQLASVPLPPPTGGLVCVPVRIPQVDPTDARKTIEVEQVTCFS